MFANPWGYRLFKIFLLNYKVPSLNMLTCFSLNINIREGVQIEDIAKNHTKEWEGPQ